MTGEHEREMNGSPLSAPGKGRRTRGSSGETTNDEVWITNWLHHRAVRAATARDDVELEVYVVRPPARVGEPLALVEIVVGDLAEVHLEVLA